MKTLRILKQQSIEFESIEHWSALDVRRINITATSEGLEEPGAECIIIHDNKVHLPNGEIWTYGGMTNIFFTGDKIRILIWKNHD